MKIGYARVSKHTQCLNLQIDALNKHGCEKIFLEKASGAKRDRPKLKEALSICKEGDSLVVWKLDRLARSTRQLIETVESLDSKKITFVSLTEDLNTKGAIGNLMFHVFASVAQFERDIITERVNAGLEAARYRGVIGGRPKTITNEKLSAARSLLEGGELKVKEICSQLNMSVASFYRHFKGGRGASEDGVLKTLTQ